ncbi:MAG TPA: DUF6265 family protein [Blastocatellia bacterium]|jgi:hypothetical protein|nr:DUF6265 family protein [Blastocatellia bacterium]
MFKRAGSCLLLVVVLGIGTNAAQKSSVDQVGWISGCWVSDDGKERIDEQWTKPGGQSMIGMSRTVAGGKTVFTEHIQIRERDGQLAYIVAIGMGAKPVVFRQIKHTDGEIVFENPEHDFPQRIIYRRESADKLFARIEGKEKGVEKAMDFRYTRGKCD